MIPDEPELVVHNPDARLSPKPSTPLPAPAPIAPQPTSREDTPVGRPTRVQEAEEIK